MRKLGEQTLVCASQEMPPQLSESDGAELKGEAHPDVWAFYREKRAADLMSQLEAEARTTVVAHWSTSPGD